MQTPHGWTQAPTMIYLLSVFADFYIIQRLLGGRHVAITHLKIHEKPPEQNPANPVK